MIVFQFGCESYALNCGRLSTSQRRRGRRHLACTWFAIVRPISLLFPVVLILCFIFGSASLTDSRGPRYSFKPRIIVDSRELGDLRPIPGARGSFGEVWVGTYRGVIVAVKKPNLPLDALTGAPVPFSEEAYDTQNAEYNRWAVLPPHPHVLPVYGAYADQHYRSLWLVSPFVRNGSLDEVMRKVRPAPWVDETWVHLVLTHAARGLVHLHDNNMMHLDCTNERVCVSVCVRVCPCVSVCVSV
jgi:hypothetical protein